MVVRREEDAELGIMEPDLRSVFAGVEGAEVTTGTSGLVGSSFVKVPCLMRGDSTSGATFPLETPIAPQEGCRSRIFGTSQEELPLLLLRTELLPPFSSKELRLALPKLERAFRGWGRPFVSTRELWLFNLGVESGPPTSSFFAAPAGVLVMRAGADTTVFRYGETYAGFLAPRTALTGCGTGLATDLVAVGILLGLAAGDLFFVGDAGSVAAA